MEQRLADLESYDTYAQCFLEAERKDQQAFNDYIAGATTSGVYQSVHDVVVVDEQNCLDLYFPYGQ